MMMALAIARLFVQLNVDVSPSPTGSSVITDSISPPPPQYKAGFYILLVVLVTKLTVYFSRIQTK